MLDCYFIDPITYKHFVSRDEWNKGTWSSLPIMGRVEWGTKLVRNFKGEQVVAAAKVSISKSITPAHEDRIVIYGVEHAIIAIQRKADFSISHWEVFIS